MSGRKLPLVPRNGHILVAGVVARISGCAKQKEVSLDDQVDLAKQEITDEHHYQGQVEYRVIATKGKGENLERPELIQIEAMLRIKELDLLICEDLGRLVRGAAASRLCGIAVDHGTRVLALNDGIDTEDPDWEDDVLDACKEHVGHNAHTSKRLKHKMMNRFKKFGGATAREIYGYVKPNGATTYDDWLRDPAATAVYREWFARLRKNPNCSAVAEWLNTTGVPTGKYARKKRWDGKMVRRITGNPILKGFPSRGSRRTVKRNERGKRVAVKNPDGPIYYHAPHLAHLDPQEWDETNAIVVAAHRGCGRKRINGTDPLAGARRTESRFPGLHARCWYCGRHYVWGGNGQAGSLMCTGAREWHCWNSVAFHGGLAVERLSIALTAELYRLDGLDDQFRGLVEQAMAEGGADLSGRRDELWRGEKSLATQKENLQHAIAAYGPSALIKAKLEEVEAAERKLIWDRREFERVQTQRPVLPASIQELRELLEGQLRGSATSSPEYAALMRQLVPEVMIYLVRLIDGGHPLPRMKATIRFDALMPGAAAVLGLGELFTKSVTVDLFDRPPQRERIREIAVALEQVEGLDQREIAARLPEPATQTAVSRALALDRLMRERGLQTRTFC